jgi:hypothetical protein
MGITERDRSRLAALIALVKSANSLAARVDALNEDDRKIYDRYSERMKEFIARNDIDENGERGNSWARSIEGYGPTLREDIQTTIYGPKRVIPIGATDDQAQQIFRKECER